MRIGAYVLFFLAGLLAFGGLLNASKPSIMPLATVIGSFALPALFTWWGVILWKKSKKQSGGER